MDGFIPGIDSPEIMEQVGERNTYTLEQLTLVDTPTLIQMIAPYPRSCQWTSINAFNYAAQRVAINYGIHIKS
jgi:hypothetical protein